MWEDGKRGNVGKEEIPPTLMKLVREWCMAHEAAVAWQNSRGKKVWKIVTRSYTMDIVQVEASGMRRGIHMHLICKHRRGGGELLTIV